ncbi:hypothetical protein P4V86_12540 [Brevibacillus laterosporus]|uniref:hypothetical protein n=1 Tax=Brevibacillus laterosporus TaxID=1465 RepID=UPI0011266376|nr:hypothetical protein [Brevibacillus laterosporus]MED2004179.1 hypothetical protein [Brevibacillus laterosporus]MED4763396.1 hypothetical protein [Brevibacillus laterosporus]
MKRKGNKRAIRHVQYDGYPYPYDPYFLPYPYPYPHRSSDDVNRGICTQDYYDCLRNCHHTYDPYAYCRSECIANYNYCLNQI